MSRNRLRSGVRSVSTFELFEELDPQLALRGIRVLAPQPAHDQAACQRLRIEHNADAPPGREPGQEAHLDDVDGVKLISS